MEEVKDYILVHGTITNIKDNVDKEYIWFDITRNEYFKDKEGNIKNNPSFFSARISKTLRHKYILDTNVEVVIKGIPKGYIDKKGYRQNYIHITEINGLELNENVFDKIISYDTDGVMLWNGKRCESEPCSEEELKELEELLKPYKEGTANE
ncbi:MAG: hypothetical protein IJ966_04885 [Bacilli bacterium]|nr:hypothetical protein [Bacilli bacterium]